MFHVHTWQKGHQLYSLSFTLFIYPPAPISASPLTWPVLHSCPSLFKCLVFVQWGFCLGILLVNILCTNQSNPLHYSSCPPSPYLVLFSSFQCFLVSCFYTRHILFFLLVSSNSPTFGNMLCIYLYIQYIYIHVYIYTCIYMIMLVFVLDQSSTKERKHAIFVFLNLANFT
jgi:hypothetical protein